MTKVSLEQQYLVFRFYYSTVTGDTPEPAGDHVLKNLITELVEYQVVQNVSLDFMRYSQGGYHIYLKIRGERSTLQTLADSLLIKLSEDYHANHASLVGLENTLGEYSLRLHERLGADHNDTKLSGHYSVEWHDEDPQLYETTDIFNRNLSFNDVFCRGLLDVFKLDVSSSTLKIFARLLLSDLMLHSDLNAEDSYYLLYFVRQQWVRFFDIEQSTLQMCEENAARSMVKFHAFLHKKSSYKDSAKTLPETLGDLYGKLFESLLPLFNQLIVRDEHNVVTNQTALRVISLLHLCHNRLGFDLNQEIIFSSLLSAYLEKQIPKQRVTELLSGADMNIENYVGDLGGLTGKTDENDEGTGDL